MRLKHDFDRDGVVVLRGCLSHHEAEVFEQWAQPIVGLREVNRFNRVEVKAIPPVMMLLPQYEEIVLAASEVLGGEVVSYNFRLVVKDKHAKDAVFLHQDVGYHIGSMPKLSAFVALSDVNEENGGMKFWLGTHRFGYLGDVGEIDRKHIPTDSVCVCPTLLPGDVVLMHSALWHESGPKLGGPDRIMADIIYQRADDPSRSLPREGLFIRSRSSRLRELQKENDALITLRATS